MGLKNKAAELAGELKASAEYAELKQAKAAVDRNGSLKSQVDELRRKQSGLYTGKISAREAESRMAELDKAFQRLSGVTEFDRYMKASAKFNELLNGTFKLINDSLEAGLR